ncbi:MAG: ABC transporter ATP-binding protein, partial [Gemmatimonadaceae bacterium]
MTDINAIEIVGLEKRFGTTNALDGIDLAVPAGLVFGFLGPNGAGKTTTLRILTGLAFPSAGTARILGHDVTRAGNQLRSRIGYLPDVPGFYAWMTAQQFLHYVGRLCGLPRATIAERSNALLEMAGLTSVHTTIGGFSRGMKQRLGIAQALINA